MKKIEYNGKVGYFISQKEKKDLEKALLFKSKSETAEVVK